MTKRKQVSAANPAISPQKSAVLATCGRRFRRLASVHCFWLLVVLITGFFLYGPQISRHIAITHEGMYLYVRAQQYLQEMQCGFYQPMLLPDTIRSAGFAFPVFYPPFGYILSAVLAKITGHKVLSVNVALFFSVLVSAVGTYFCAYALTRRGSLAALASVIYISATYRFVNVYVRGALAESWGSAWYPVALYGVVQVLRGTRGGIWMALGLAGALLSHTVVTMYYVCALALIAALPVLIQWSTRRLVLLVFYGLIGLGVCGAYIVPQQSYLPLVWASDPHHMWAEPGNLILHGIELSQLFQAMPDKWFGNSYRHPVDEMSFQLGLGYMLCAISLAGALGYWRNWKLKKLNTLLGIGLLITSTGMLLFIVYPQWFIFILPSKFSYLQFPWRLLSVLPLLAAMLTVVAVPHSWLQDRRLVNVASLVLICVLVASIPHFFNTRRLKLDITSDSLTPEYARSQGDNGCTESADYLPRSYPMEQREHFYIEEPAATNGRVVEWNRGHGLVSCRAKVDMGDGGGTLTVPVTYYPFWFATDAMGKMLDLQPDRGYIRVKLPQGTSTVQFTRRYTRPYYVGWAITLISIMGLGVVNVLDRKFRQEKYVYAR